MIINNEDNNIDIDYNINYLIDILMKEFELYNIINDIIIDIKKEKNFTLQDLFFVIKSYSYITLESLSAFFDRNNINYNDDDLKSIFNRIQRGKENKICFNKIKNLFEITDYNNNIGFFYNNYDHSNYDNNNEYYN